MTKTSEASKERRTTEKSENGGYAAEMMELFDAVGRELKEPIYWPRFKMGRLVISREAERKLQPEDVIDAMVRHGACDWGAICGQDKAANDQAFHKGGRLVSRYRSQSGLAFWLITGADRSVTTVLLPIEC